METITSALLCEGATGAIGTKGGTVVSARPYRRESRNVMLKSCSKGKRQSRYGKSVPWIEVEHDY
jgi:hypothetical protein